MTAKEFALEYNKIEEDIDKQTYIMQHIKQLYIPFADKLAITKEIAWNTTHTTVNEGTGFDAVVFEDKTNERFLSFVFSILKYYTSIEVSESGSLEEFGKQYDELEEYGIASAIISVIRLATSVSTEIITKDGETYNVANDEISTLENMINAEVENIITNETSPVAYLGKRTANVKAIFMTGVIPYVKETVEKFIKEVGSDMEIKDFFKNIADYAREKKNKQNKA